MSKPKPKPRKTRASQNTLGRRFQRARRALGLTQAQLADRIGLSNRRVSHVECGYSRTGKALSRPSRSAMLLFEQVEAEAARVRKRAKG